MQLKLSPAGRRYGAFVAPPDHRDNLFCTDFVHVPKPGLTLSWKFPFVHHEKGPVRENHVSEDDRKASLLQWAGPVKDQGQLGCCTGFTGAGYMEVMAREFPQAFPKLPLPSQAIFSPMFCYWWNRRNDGRTEWEAGQIDKSEILKYTTEDRGANIRSVMRTLRWQGLCLENEDPYNPRNYTAKPDLRALDEAIDFRLGKYMSLGNDLAKWRWCLKLGYPIAIGFTVYSSFEDPQVARTGILPLPRRGERVEGGHAVLVIGYDDTTGHFLVRNSWGRDWGQDGNFLMPYDFAENSSQVFDAWMITLPTQ
jgi:hypothetical protein